MNKTLIGAALAGLVLAGCGGGDNNNSGPRYVQQIAVPGVGSTTNYAFDISTVSGNTYYFGDRTNAAVTTIDIPTLAFANALKGTGANAFAGAQSSNGTSGPNGVDVIGSVVYAGDVNSVKIIDPTTKTVVKTITVGTNGTRADEGCVDSAHKLYMISTPEGEPPFATFIDTTTQTVVAHVTFTDPAGAASAGLEACAYDAAGDTFYVNNDGTTANPHGELTALTGASIRGIPAGTTVNYTTLAGMRTYAVGNCDPTGLALGPGTDIAVNCREGTTGAPLLVQIMNRSTGAIVASVPAGGGDQLVYDAGTNRYYSGASRWTASGKAATNGSCSTASPCTPMLQIIDAAARTVVASIPTGNNAHSVAVDPTSGLAFMPISSASAPAGCATCTANGFLNAGVAVFATH